MSYNYIISNLLILYYIILLCYIILNLFYYLFTIYLQSNIGKVKLERSRLWQLDNSRRKSLREADGGGGNTKVCLHQGLLSSDLYFLWGYDDVGDR